MKNVQKIAASIYLLFLDREKAQIQITCLSRGPDVLLDLLVSRMLALLILLEMTWEKDQNNRKITGDSAPSTLSLMNANNLHTMLLGSETLHLLAPCTGPLQKAESMKHWHATTGRHRQVEQQTPNSHNYISVNMP